MKKFIMVAFAWWFIAADSNYQLVGVQFGPFRDKETCEQEAKAAHDRISHWQGQYNGYVSKCWEGTVNDRA